MGKFQARDCRGPTPNQRGFDIRHATVVARRHADFGIDCLELNRTTRCRDARHAIADRLKSYIFTIGRPHQRPHQRHGILPKIFIGQPPQIPARECNGIDLCKARRRPPFKRHGFLIRREYGVAIPTVTERRGMQAALFPRLQRKNHDAPGRTRCTTVGEHQRLSVSGPLG